MFFEGLRSERQLVQVAADRLCRPIVLVPATDRLLHRRDDAGELEPGGVADCHAVARSLHSAGPAAHQFRYRAKSPLFLPYPFTVNGKSEGLSSRLWASNHVG